MRSLLSWLGIGSEAPSATDAAETATVRRIVGELESLPPERARYIAAFAYLLGRVAHADLEVSAEETRTMASLVETHGHLPPQQAALVVEIAKGQVRLFGGTENYLVARELAGIASRRQCEELLHCLFAVSAADGVIAGDEEQQIRLIADQLGFSPKDFIEVRSAYNDQRSVIQRLDRDR